MEARRRPPSVRVERHLSRSARTVDHGKPVARRGRKARDLSETARLPAYRVQRPSGREFVVKARLAQFAWVLTLLATMALSIGAGMRWY